MFCPKCGADAGDANFCPKCGAKIPQQPVPSYQPMHIPLNKKGPKKKHKVWKIILVTVLGIILGTIILSIIFPASDETNSSSSSISSKVNESNSSKTSSKPVSSKLATYETKNNGTVSITVNSVDKKDSVSAGLLTEYQPKAGAKILVVNLKVKNTSNEAYSFLVSNFQLYSNDGKKYSPSAMLTAKNYLNAESINPGVSISGDVGFEIPESMKPSDFTLKFQDIVSSDNNISIKLK